MESHQYAELANINSFLQDSTGKVKAVNAKRGKGENCHLILEST